MKLRMTPDLTFAIDGNRMALYASGEARKALILDRIADADNSLDLLFYDLADDASGTAIRDALADAAGRGVRVRLVIDGKYVTSVGGGMSYEPAFWLVERLWGPARVAGNAQGLVWPWDLEAVPHLVTDSALEASDRADA